MSDSLTKPIIFISYSHKDEPDQFLEPGEVRWLTYVRSFLEPAATNGLVEVWDDRRIDGGGLWRKDINEALERCTVCVFLVSRHSLSSQFICDIEMKRMIERHHARGAHLFPILISSTDLGIAPWLMALNLKPSNKTPLELYERGPRNKLMSELAKRNPPSSWLEEWWVTPSANPPYEGASPSRASAILRHARDKTTRRANHFCFSEILSIP
jgi:hypothetical protein